MIGKVLHSSFCPRTADPLGMTVYVWIMIGWAYFVRHGVFEFIITERFHWWFALAALLAVSVLSTSFVMLVRARIASRETGQT